VQRTAAEFLQLLAQGIDRLEGPFRSASMEQLAAASGIPRSTLYHRFANKDTILRALLEAMIDDLEVSTKAALSIQGPASMRLEAVVRAQLDHLASNPAASRLLVGNLADGAGLLDVFERVDAAFIQPVRRMFESGREDGSLLVPDPGLASEALYGAVTVTGLRRLLRDGSIAVDELADDLMRMFAVEAVHDPAARTTS